MGRQFDRLPSAVGRRPPVLKDMQPQYPTSQYSKQSGPVSAYTPRNTDIDKLGQAPSLLASALKRLEGNTLLFLSPDEIDALVLLKKISKPPKFDSAFLKLSDSNKDSELNNFSHKGLTYKVYFNQHGSGKKKIMYKKRSYTVRTSKRGSQYILVAKNAKEKKKMYLKSLKRKS